MRSFQVLTFALVTFTACQGHKADVPSEAAKAEAEPDIVLTPPMLAAAGVLVEAPRLVPARTSVPVTGMLEFEPNRVARVGPLIQGRIVSIRVDPGQHVTPGTILATVESVEVGRARADYLASQVRMTQADRERARQAQLADGGMTTGQDIAVAQTAKELANLESRAAAERLRAVGVQPRDLSFADGGAAGGRPSAAMALTTPLGGLVLEVNARVGQAVSATDTVFVVGEIDRVWLIVDVYERDLAKVHVGDEAHATVIAYADRTFDGKVDYVGGIVDPVRRAVPARIVLANPDGALRPGMSASAHVYAAANLGATSSANTDGAAAGGSDATPTNGSSQLVLVVPRGALQTIDGQPYVFVEKAQGRFTLRAVERGNELERDVEITKGLSATDRVASTGTFVLKSEALREQMGKND